MRNLKFFKIKRSLLLLVCFLTVNYGFSQVGIGTSNPNSSSILDISSSNKGVLFPRMDLATAPIDSPVEGLVVWNTDLANEGANAGLFYWNGSAWVSLISNDKLDSQIQSIQSSSSGGGSGADVWQKGGNEAADGDFMGTTNEKALEFRVNNERIAYIEPNGGLSMGKNASANNYKSIAIGNGAQSIANTEAIAVGVESNASAYRSLALGALSESSGNEAIAVGLQSNASNYRSLALGVLSESLENEGIAVGVQSKALAFQAISLGSLSRSSANEAIAVGVQSNTSGFRSVAIGSLSTSSNNDAVALGIESSASGQKSTALGSNSNASGQNSVAIGYNSSATNPNTIILGNNVNSGGNATKVGIGTSNPTEKLEVNGSIKITDGTQGAGKVLTSDANGKASWQDAPSGGGSSSSANVGYGEIYINNDVNVTFQRYSNTTFPNGIPGLSSANVNANNNGFQPNFAGVFKVTYTVTYSKNSSNGTGEIEFYLTKNNNKINGTAIRGALKNGERVTVSLTKIIELEANQTYYLQISKTEEAPNNGPNVTIYKNASNISIELIE